MEDRSNMATSALAVRLESVFGAHQSGGGGRYQPTDNCCTNTDDDDCVLTAMNDAILLRKFA